MRRLCASLTILLASANVTYAGSTLEELDNDLETLSYCLGFWNGLESALENGVDEDTLSVIASDEVDRTHSAIDDYTAASAFEAKFVNRPTAKMLRLFSAGLNETQTSLRDAQRITDLNIQTAARKMIKLVRPTCDRAIARAEVNLD